MATATKDSVTVKFDPNAVNLQADIISAATESSAGVMSAAQVQQLNAATAEIAALAGGEAVALYVSPGGSNTNDGLSPATALASFYEAWKRAVAVNWTQARIFVTGSVPLEAVAYVNSQRAIGVGTGIIVIGSFVPQVIGPAGLTLGTETAGDPTGQTFTDAALTMTPGAFASEAFLLCTGGANAGARANIQSNTATSITIAAPFANPIAIGDTFEVQLPGSELVKEPGAAVFGFGNSYVGWQGIKITGSPGALVVTDEAKFVTDGLIIDAAFHVVVIRQNAFFRGSLDSPWSGDGAANPFNPGSTSGTLFKNAIVLHGESGELTDNHMFNNALLLTVFVQPRFSLSSAACINTSFVMSNKGYLGIGAGIIDGGFITGPPPVGLDDDTLGDLGSASPLVIQNASANPGISITNRSFANCNNVTGATGNTGPGIVVDDTSQLNTNGTTSLTGSAPGVNDMVVAGTPVAYGALPFLAAGTIGYAK